MPFSGDLERFSKDAFNLVYQSGSESAGYFERKLVEGFVDKLEAGIDIPNYPQFRDMNRMFFEMISGIEKVKQGYVETGVLSLRSGKADISEASALNRSSKEIYERIGGTFRVKICITGPYTLSSFFAHRDPQIYGRLGDILLKIVEGNIFDNKYGSVKILAVDEPVFGLLDDPQIDVGSVGRENLLRAWEKICHGARQKGVETCIHLHNTNNELFWQVDSLRIIESHIGDPLYSSERTKRLLGSNDKLLKASIGITIFDRLIERYLLSKPKDPKSEVETEKIGEVWRGIRKGKIEPVTFIDSVEVMEKRLKEIIERFGLERVPYAGSECGLRSFPTYECAIECLNRVSRATKTVNQAHP